MYGMTADRNAVKNVYAHVINDVIDGVREAFLDDGMDEMVLQELKQLWETKLNQCKAVSHVPPPPPPVVEHRPAVPVRNTVPAVQVQPQVAQTPTLVNPAAALLLQQPMQTQLLRLQAAQQSAVAGNISAFANIQNMTVASQIAHSALPASFLRHLATFNPNGSANNPLIVPTLHPTSVAPSVVQTTTALDIKQVVQLDGLGDSSSEDDDDHNDDDDEDDEQNDDNETNGEEEDPLNSGDDVSDADPTEVFDAENVVVCQFEKINRCKNRWKFHLKDGIMNLNGRDYLFQKATGDAEW
jgi:transcription initiation factor TFIIA large subunit